MSYQKEIEELISYWNTLFDKKFKYKKSLEKNYAYWAETYTLEEMKEAINNLYHHRAIYWNKTPTPTWFLRTRNSNGECDYIEELLNNYTVKEGDWF